METAIKLGDWDFRNRQSLRNTLLSIKGKYAIGQDVFDRDHVELLTQLLKQRQEKDPTLSDAKRFFVEPIFDGSVHTEFRYEDVDGVHHRFGISSLVDDFKPARRPVYTVPVFTPATHPQVEITGGTSGHAISPLDDASRMAAPITLNFGKHKGETLAAIVLADPGYISWIMSKPAASFSKKLMTAVTDIYTAHRDVIVAAAKEQSKQFFGGNVECEPAVDTAPAATTDITIQDIMPKVCDRIAAGYVTEGFTPADMNMCRRFWVYGMSNKIPIEWKPLVDDVIVELKKERDPAYALYLERKAEAEQYEAACNKAQAEYAEKLAALRQAKESLNY